MLFDIEWKVKLHCPLKVDIGQSKFLICTNNRHVFIYIQSNQFWRKYLAILGYHIPLKIILNFSINKHLQVCHWLYSMICCSFWTVLTCNYKAVICLAWKCTERLAFLLCSMLRHVIHLLLVRHSQVFKWAMYSLHDILVCFTYLAKTFTYLKIIIAL